jgi:hypothetical protein
MKVRSLRKTIKHITRKAPGTVYGRFDYLLHQLEMRFETDRFSARPPEVLLLEKLDKERFAAQALREAVKAAIIAGDTATIFEKFKVALKEYDEHNDLL